VSARWVRYFRCLALLGSLGPGARAADHCAPAPPPRARALGLGLGASLEHASYWNETYAGTYEGLWLSASYASREARGPRWDVAAELPFYHLVRNGQDQVGPGDPFLRGRLTFWRRSGSLRPEEGVALGAALGLSLPLGDADADLGMGHVMIHPGLWLRTTAELLRSEWTLSYGRVLGSGEHAHGTGPLVSPMNESEATLGGALSLRIMRPLDLVASGMMALPVAAEGGEARGTVSLGMRLLLRAVDVSVGLALPALGDPFEQKLEVGVAHSF